ncbi:MAG TPA: hypothetical protein VH415_12055 [Nitrososphaeraceae archaeon]|jgi:predicted transcriptional regulator
MKERLTELEILNSISDKLSLDIFCSIAEGVSEGSRLKSTLALSRKQYYSRTERMLKAGIIKRKKGRFSLTSLGIIAYHTQMQLETALKNYWNLKAIDSIQDLHTMSREERLKMIKKLVSDKTIQNILESRVHYFEK